MSDASGYRIVDVTPDKAVGSVRVIRNHWWWLIDGDPSKAVFYVGTGWRTRWSPQCNTDRRIVDSLGVPFEGAKVTFVPIAFAPRSEAADA